MRKSGHAKERIRTEALCLRKVPLGESDVIVTLFTRQMGVLSALARSARNSSKRFTALEPIHTLSVSIDFSPQKDLQVLTEANLATARVHVLSNLEAIQMASTALQWLRDAMAPMVADDRIWNVSVTFLDLLNDNVQQGSSLLVFLGLHLLDCLGWGLNTERCAECGNEWDPLRVVWIHPVRGILCSNCAKEGRRVMASVVNRFGQVMRGEFAQFSEAELSLAREIISGALLFHTRKMEKRV